MEMDNKKPFCPVLDVDGVISGGKQFDLDITLPEDNRDVIYGVLLLIKKENSFSGLFVLEKNMLFKFG